MGWLAKLSGMGVGLLAAGTLALVGCGGGLAGSAGTALPTDSPSLAGPGGMVVPAPAELKRQASYYYDNQRWKLGHLANGADGFQQNTTPNGDTLAFNPPNNPTLVPAFTNSARAAFYLEHLEDYHGPAQVNLDWVTAPAAENLWIGLGNFDAGKWVWRHPTDVSTTDFGPDPQPFIDGAGEAIILIFITGGLEAQLGRAQFGPDIWEITEVDTAGATGFETSLALDSLDRPHIAYYDKDQTALRYARLDGSVWSTITIDGAVSNTGNTPSLALDSAGFPVIAYQDVDALSLRLARFDGANWNYEDVDAGGDTGYYPALALDSENYPRIAYYDGFTMSYKYAYNGPGGWGYSFIAPRNGSSTIEISLILTGADTPHVLYVANQKATYAYYDGMNWPSTVLGGVNASVNGESLAFDDGLLYAVYYEYADSRAYLVKREDIAWGSPELILDEVNFGWSGSIQVGLDHQPRFVCYGNGPRFLTWTGVDWLDVNFDNNGWSGHYNSMVLDSNGLACISYHHPGNEDLRFARQLEAIY